MIDLKWSQLIPGGDASADERLFAIIDHYQLPSPVGQMSLSEAGEQMSVADMLVAKYDGKRVRLPGYMAPFEFNMEGVREFLLAPFVGACLHVPPPPPNQLVFVRAETPYQTDSYMIQPVLVTGVFGRYGDMTELAQVGYEIIADKVEPYSG